MGFVVGLLIPRDKKGRHGVPTTNELVREERSQKKEKTATPALQGSPQRRGVCTGVARSNLKKAN